MVKRCHARIGLANQTSLIGGDARCLSIACASVVAKNCRDTLMTRLHPRYPDFHWDCNKGYGTAEHLTALQDQGPTIHHRHTYAPVRQQNDLFSLLSVDDPILTPQ